MDKDIIIDDRQEFIDTMKANPNWWGRQCIKGTNRNEFILSRGWVYIYNRFGDLCNTYYFANYKEKLNKISLALKQIKHLKYYYVEISHNN